MAVAAPALALTLRAQPYVRRHGFHRTSTQLAIIEAGLKPTAAPQRVIIVGAGMAGLVAAYELKRAGHDPIVLEAQQRVGGRVCTLREPFTHGLYGEVGAMRIPRAHRLTMAYIEKFGLTVSPFTMGNPNSYFVLHGSKQRAKDVDANPDSLGFDLHDHERGKSPFVHWASAIKPIVAEIEKRGEAAWNDIVARYDRYSTRQFLEANNWSEGLIECFGLLADQEAQMNFAFLEYLREQIGNHYVDMVEIDGGMDRLPFAFLPALHGQIRFGAKMSAMDQTDNDVTIHYHTAAGKFSVTGSRAIITVPFPVLRHVDTRKPFSRGKQRRSDNCTTIHRRKS